MKKLQLLLNLLPCVWSFDCYFVSWHFMLLSPRFELFWQSFSTTFELFSTVFRSTFQQRFCL